MGLCEPRDGRAPLVMRAMPVGVASKSGDRSDCRDVLRDWLRIGVLADPNEDDLVDGLKPGGRPPLTDWLKPAPGVAFCGLGCRLGPFFRGDSGRGKDGREAGFLS